MAAMEYSFLRCISVIILLNNHIGVWIRYTVAEVIPQDSIQDYCKRAVFEPRCPPNEIIMITHALYGRMRTGSCISRSYGTIGCQADIISILDSECSGKSSCQFPVASTLMAENTNPCDTDELSNYLEAAYRCIQVVPVSRDICQSCEIMKIDSPHDGYIASQTSADTRCGKPDCPWLLEAARGQRIKISLIDFAHADSSYHETGICQVYAIVKEALGDKSVTICGGQEKERVIYESTGNALEIQILATNSANKRFLIHYTFEGCPDLEPEEGITTKREGSQMSLHCDGNGVSSSMRCNGTNWIGTKPDCSKTRSNHVPAEVGGVLGDPGTHHAEDKSAKEGHVRTGGSTQQKAYVSDGPTIPMEMILGSAAIITVGLIACVIIIAIVSIKRREYREQSLQQPRVSIYEVYDDPCLRRPSNKPTGDVSSDGYQTLPADYHKMRAATLPRNIRYEREDRPLPQTPDYESYNASYDV